MKYLLYNLKPLEEKRLGVMCLDCGWMRISWNRHDCRICPCPQQAMVDGGTDYLRCGAVDLSRIQTVEVGPVKEKRRKKK